jgi:hypothetical protein
MITVGDKKLFYSATFLVADNVDVVIDVPTPSSGPMPFLIRFKPSTTNEQAAQWRTEGGRIILEFSGWNNPLGTTYAKPVRIGELDGQPLGFQLTNRYIAGTNLVHFFLFQGGLYG